MHKWLITLLALSALAACGAHEPRPDPQPDKQAPVKVNAVMTGDAADQAANAEESITDRMAGEHAGDTPAASEAAKQLPSEEVEARQVAYFKRAGEPITGYLAHPEGKTEDLPTVLVIHEWWGLNDNVKAMTRRIAGEGYVALAVDLYRGDVAEEPQAARRFMSKVMQNQEEALINISAARRWLESEYSPSKLGVIGWCFGGGWALRGALNMKDDVDAVVMYYGEVTTDDSELADLEAPLLGIFGAEDKGIPPQRVREFEDALETLDKDADITIYEGAGHAFANPSGQQYDEEAAEKAWAKTTAFLEEHLKD